MSSKIIKSSIKKVVKPLNPTEFDNENVRFSNVMYNTEIGLKWVNTSYAKTPGSEDKMLIVVRNCVVKIFKKMENNDKNGKEYINKNGSPRKDKYNIFAELTDENFINMIQTYEDYLVDIAEQKGNDWFNQELTKDDCRSMLVPFLSKHPKYGYSIGGVLDNDCTCISKTEDVPDVSDLIIALAKGTVIDMCICLNKISLNTGTNTYKIGIRIAQINITGVGTGGEYQPSGIKPEDYVPSKISLTKQQQHEKGGKFCKILYDEKPLCFILENVNGRIFKFDKEGQVSYSISIRLTDKVLRKMVEGLDKDIFDQLLINIKEYFGPKKSPKLLRPTVKSIYSYNKSDQEKISKKEKPMYDPSIWIKIYHSDEKGFDGKVINLETGKPIVNIEDIITKDLSIASLNAYSRHIWFGPKGTSINFTLNKCAISYEATEYDMDNVENDESEEEVSQPKHKEAEKDDDDDEEVEVEENEEADNSD